MNIALARGWRKALRTVLQIAAGGGLTLLVTAVAGHLNPAVSGLILGAWTAFVAFAQNWAETAGKIPTLLPSPGLVVGPAADVVVGTVDAVVEETGEIAGDVLDVAGDVVGEVVGQLDHDERGGLWVGVAIFIAALVLLFVACDALIDDDSEENDLGQGVELVSYDYDDEGDENSGNGRRCEGSEDCSSFSPSFEKSPVEDSFNPDITFCLPFARCDGSEEEPAPA